MTRLFKQFLCFVIIVIIDSEHYYAWWWRLLASASSSSSSSSSSSKALSSVLVTSFILDSSSSSSSSVSSTSSSSSLRRRQLFRKRRQQLAFVSAMNDNDCATTKHYTKQQMLIMRMTNNKKFPVTTIYERITTDDGDQEEDQEQPKNYNGNPNRSVNKQRRGMLRSVVVAVITVVGGGALTRCLAAPAPCHAFENGLPEMINYTNKPKHPGTPPTNIGRQPGTGKLAPCNTGAPNCFSTTLESNEEGFVLPTWKPNTTSSSIGSGTATRMTNKSRKQIMNELRNAIESYPPGQARIDKGGFKIMTSTENYLYIQFESMKHGFIDDVEFALLEDENKNIPIEVQVRSSSRIGFLDLGVNGKRLNWFATYLQTTYGWDIPEQITPTNYSDYFPMMPFSYDDYIRSVLSPSTCPVPANPLDCRDPPSGPV